MQRPDRVGGPTLPAGPQLAKNRQEGHQQVLVEDILGGQMIRCKSKYPGTKSRMRVLEMGHFEYSGTELWDAHVSDTIGPLLEI